MKKQFIFSALFICVLNFCLVAEDLYFQALRDTPYFRTDIVTFLKENASGVLLTGEKVILDKSKMSYYNPFGTNSVDGAEYIMGQFLIKGSEYRIVANDLIPWGTDDVFDQSLLTIFEGSGSRSYLMSYTQDVLRSKNRERLFEYEPFWSNPRNSHLSDEFGDLTPWHKYYSYRVQYHAFPHLLIANSYLNLFAQGLAIKSIKSTDTGYLVTVKILNDWWESKGPVPLKFDSVQNKTFFDIKMIIDGDYIDFVLVENNTKLATVVAVNNEYINQYANLIANETCDLSNITWPRHADGSCDYEVSEERRQEKNLMYRTIDNLRLRSAEETSSDILTTLEKGTIVTVLSLGKEDIIDGIKANWVKVQLEDGTKGWCFGGYLLPAPIEMTGGNKSNQAEEPNENTNSKTNTFAALSATTLIVGGGVVILLLGAGVFLFLKRKK